MTLVKFFYAFLCSNYNIMRAQKDGNNEKSGPASGAYLAQNDNLQKQRISVSRKIETIGKKQN